MNAARVLLEARRRAGLSQRQLAQRAGMPQPAIAKIETGRVIPRVDTLDKLLAACGEALEAVPRVGIGVDRTMFPALLELSYAERGRKAGEDSNAMDRLLKNVKFKTRRR